MITIKYPNPDPYEGGYLAQDLPYVPGKTLRLYLKEMRLLPVALRSNIRNEATREVLRLTWPLSDGVSVVLFPTEPLS